MALTALRIDAVIPAYRRLVIDLPPATPTGRAELIILTTAEQPKANGPAILRWLDEHAAQPYQGRTAEEIDRQIEKERAAWE